MLFTPGHEKTVKVAIVNLRTLLINPETAVVVNIDTINGFFKQGALSSSRMVAVIPQIRKVNEYFLSSRKLFFTDWHKDGCPEFNAFPAHCVSEEEQQIISELAPFSSTGEIFRKNSTNGFLSMEYLAWMTKHCRQIENYIIVGGVTDICVLQYALTQKAYLNENNIRAGIVVVENAVQTFHSAIHNGDDMHFFALYNMLLNGIKLAQI